MLAGFTGYDRGRIGPATRLYHDAGLHGLDYQEFMVWYSHRFEVDLTGLDLRQMAPGEARGFRLLGRPKYLEMTVQALLDLAQGDSWRDSGLAGRLARR